MDPSPERDGDAEYRRFSQRRARRVFWLALVVLAAFLVPNLLMALYQAITGKLPI